MSHEVISAVIRGASGFVAEADEKLSAALAKHGPDKQVGFPGTAFHLPMACALMGIEAKQLSDLQPIVEHCKEILPVVPTKELWLPYLGNGLDAGAATLLATEVTCALRYLDGENTSQIQFEAAVSGFEQWIWRLRFMEPCILPLADDESSGRGD